MRWGGWMVVPAALLVQAQAEGSPAVSASSGEDDDVIEVGGATRGLPRVAFAPHDAASEGVARRLAGLVARTGIYDTLALAPGERGGEWLVQVVVVTTPRGVSTAALTRAPDGALRRRQIDSVAPLEPLDLARLADAVVADLSGERSHLSGRLVHVEASRPGERRVRVMLGSGELLQDVSTPGQIARGADASPGGVLHFAGSRPGEPLALYREDQPRPVPLQVPGFVQAISFAADGKAAVVIGDQGATSIWLGIPGGSMQRLSGPPGVQASPSFGPGGLLAFVQGPADGPLRVWLQDRPVSPAGAWAAAPSFCGRDPGAPPRLAYMLRHGSSWTIMVHDALTGATRGAGPGQHPICSPDGRTLLVHRPGAPGGLWTVGVSGLGARELRPGAMVGGRWLPGPPLPPEG